MKGIKSIFINDIHFVVRVSIKVRWIIGITVLLLPVILPAFNLFISTIPVIITGIVIISYNLIFYYYERRMISNPKSESNSVKMNGCIFRGRLQILLDYITLAVILYSIGGFHTNLFYFLLFHLIVGSIILSIQYMYLMVFFSISGFIAVSLLQMNKFIPCNDLFNRKYELTLQTVAVETLIHSVIFIIIVFMISQLTKRIRKDNIQLTEVNRYLEESLNGIKKIEQRKSKFMRYSAHQLRSPLATIIASNNVIEKKLIPLDSERAFTLISGANKKAKSLLELVIDLLELSKIRDERKKSLNDENINIIFIIENIIFSLFEKINLKKLTIKRNYSLNGHHAEFDEVFNYEKDFNKFINLLPEINIPIGDKELLKQAFYNIIENAVKYTDEGDEIVIDILDCNENGKMVISIKDSGIGIDKDFIQDIFFEFVRSPNAKEVLNDGTGLGLSIAKEIFTRHDGTITVESELSKGTKFIIIFPVK